MSSLNESEEKATWFPESRTSFRTWDHKIEMKKKICTFQNIQPDPGGTEQTSQRNFEFWEFRLSW